MSVDPTMYEQGLGYGTLKGNAPRAIAATKDGVRVAARADRLAKLSETYHAHSELQLRALHRHYQHNDDGKGPEYQGRMLGDVEDVCEARGIALT